MQYDVKVEHNKSVLFALVNKPELVRRLFIPEWRLALCSLSLAYFSCKWIKNCSGNPDEEQRCSTTQSSRRSNWTARSSQSLACRIADPLCVYCSMKAPSYTFCRTSFCTRAPSVATEHLWRTSGVILIGRNRFQRMHRPCNIRLAEGERLLSLRPGLLDTEFAGYFITICVFVYTTNISVMNASGLWHFFWFVLQLQ